MRGSTSTHGRYSSACAEMWLLNAVFICGLLAGAALCQELRKFPDGFLFGTATASYQVEGAWNVSDKSENVWDRFCHTTDGIRDGSSGDVADDSYHLFRRDVEMMRELGIDFYRFSISWSRLLPNGFANYISEDGKRYYNEFIDELIANDIQPMITIFHWDLPQRLQDLGGWANPLIAEWFEDYARVVYDLFADRVKLWATLNEPSSYCINGYGSNSNAPGVDMNGIADFMCVKNSMLAHARAWRLFDREYRPIHGGINGYTNHLIWFEPESDSPEDQEASAMAHEIYNGMYSHPVYTAEGGWPPALEALIAARSAAEGYPRSRLPAFTQEEIELIRGTYDYFGVQYYTSKLVRYNGVGDADWGLTHEFGGGFSADPSWGTTQSYWFQVNPPGFRNILKLVKERYSDPVILVTENGYSSSVGADDEARVRYYRDHLDQLLDAIYLDDCRITHYTAWSLMDNFEWSDGYMSRFGLYEVDYEDPERTRRPRKSALVYKEILRSRTIDYSYQPPGLEMSVTNCTYDFFGVQYYTSRLVRYNGVGDPGWVSTVEFGGEILENPSWETAPSPLVQVNPPGFRNILKLVKDRYSDPVILVTENGYPSTVGVDDEARVRYYRDHLEQLLDAIYLDDCQITHYTAWSLMDNFEWSYGYISRFGLYEVDYEDPERTRRPRKSALVYKEILRSRTIDYSYQPLSVDTSITNQ